MAEARSRMDTFENLLDASKHGGLGAHNEFGFGPRDPMCLTQHVYHRLVQPEEKASTQAPELVDASRLHLIELQQKELTALAKMHDREVGYRQDLGQLDSKGAAKLTDFTEFLEKIVAKEKPKYNDVEFDVDLDFARVVEKELAEAAEREKERREMEARQPARDRDAGAFNYTMDYRTTTGGALAQQMNRYSEQIGQALFNPNPFWNAVEGESPAVAQQRQENRVTLRELVTVSQDPSSQDYVWTQNGNEVHRLSQAALLDGTGHSQVAVAVPQTNSGAWISETADSVPDFRHMTATATLTVGSTY